MLTYVDWDVAVAMHANGPNQPLVDDALRYV